jgi:hypothetical protein
MQSHPRQGELDIWQGRTWQSGTWWQFDGL